MDKLTALSSIGELVQKRFSSATFPREVMEILLKMAECQRCCLFSLNYKDACASSLSVIHIVPDYRAEVSRIEQKAFDESVPYFLVEDGTRHLFWEDSQTSTLYFPIRLGENLSAILSLDFIPECSVVRHQKFIFACLPLFSLWFAGANLRKTMNDVCNFTREPIYIMNTAGVLEFWNQAMTDLSGWNSEQMIGQGDYQNAVPFYGEKRLTVPHLILNPDPAFEKKHYLEFRREGDVVHAITFLPTVLEDGAYVSCKTQRLYDISGMLYAAIHSLQDLTHVRQLETDLHRLRFIGRMVNDLSENGIALVNQEGLTYYNDKMFAILGLDLNAKPALKDILGLAAKASKGERDKVIAFNKQVLNREDPTPPFIEFTIHEEGKSRDLRYTAYIESAEETSIMLIFTDITRERSLISQAKDNEMKVLRADRLSSLGLLSAGIAHEIAQPLGIIKVLVDTFLVGQDLGWSSEPGSIDEQFRLIGKQIDRMSAIIDGIRVFSRDESEQDQAVCDVNLAIMNVLDIVKRQFNERHVRVTVCYSERPLMVRCSLGRLEQVIMNILLNARQNLESCYAHGLKEIVITTHYNSSGAYAFFKDNGTGIPNENLQRIFDPFFTTKEIGQGTGLGLSICKAIINSAGGDIEVKNNPARGSTFQVFLPFMETADESSAG